MLMCRVVQLVLHRCEKPTSEISVGVIVDTGDEYVRHLLIEVPFTASDVTDALQQLSEIAATITLQSFIIKHESLLNKLTKMCRCPLAETSGHLRLNPIAHGNNHVQIVVEHVSPDASVALLSN